MRGWAADLLGDSRTWLVFAGLVGLAAAGARPLARRTGWPVWPTAGALVSAAVVGTLTLAPGPGLPVTGPELAGLADCLRSLPDPGAWLRALVATGERGERVGNVAMFVPVCAFAVLATRRPVRVAVAGMLAPVAIEIGQALIGGGRDCAADDWVNNATGAVLGTLLGVAAGAALTRLGAGRVHSGDPPPPAGR